MKWVQGSWLGEYIVETWVKEYSEVMYVLFPTPATYSAKQVKLTYVLSPLPLHTVLQSGEYTQMLQLALMKSTSKHFLQDLSLIFF